MTTPVTLELPESLARQIQAVAAQTQQRLEDVLIEWLTRAAAELPVHLLDDEQVLQLCEQQLDTQQQERLSDLLEGQREQTLTTTDQIELAELMQRYRHGLLRKAEALKVAVDRGLRPPLEAEDGSPQPFG